MLRSKCAVFIFLPDNMAAPARPTKGAAKPWLKGQADDLASLANLDEVVLLEELKERYKTDKIYVCDGVKEIYNGMVVICMTLA